jgi:hypothetical protein
MVADDQGKEAVDVVAYKERAPGIYRAKFVKLDTDYHLTDKETGEDITRWRWVFQETGDTTTMGEMDTLTSTGFKSRSNGLKFFTGMLGRAPTPADDTDALLGQTFDVVFGPNQNGRHTITNVLRVGVAEDQLLPEMPKDKPATLAGAELP